MEKINCSKRLHEDKVEKRTGLGDNWVIIECPARIPVQDHDPGEKGETVYDG